MPAAGAVPTSTLRLVHVAVLSALGLHFELLLIRWLDSQVRPLAYVKNLPLLASFLGLGIGFAIAGRRKSWLPVAPLLIALALAVGLLFAGPIGLVEAGPAGPESNLGIEAGTTLTEVALFYLAVGLVFALTVLALVPLGQAAGERMAGLPSLRAYSANVAGALCGIVLAFLLAAVSIPPWASAALGFAVLLGYARPSGSLRLGSAVVVLLICGGMAANDHRPGQRTVWSPYNKIEILERPSRAVPFALKVQNLYYQRIVDLSPGRARDAEAEGWRQMYDPAYAWFAPRRVLVLGAGTGNDVAAALRDGAEHVDAVEIDPRILGFGRELHPEGPYSSPRVRSFASDARAFLEAPGESYDLVVFGLLDAHTSFYSSFAGNIRLDNYVYTVESFRRALARLAPDGAIALTLYVERPWIGSRAAAMLAEAWGRPPKIRRINETTFLYLAGPGVEGRVPEQVLEPYAKLIAEQAPGPSARDDWPFLYLESRTIAPAIRWAALGVIAISLLLVRLLFRGAIRLDRHFFLLGAGFLLVETRTIAQLGLLFGSTWRVSGFTIAVILGLILLANTLAGRWGGPGRPLLYALLLATLVLGWVFPVGRALGTGVAGAIAMAVFALLPLFFAALIFASSVKEHADLRPVMASNLLGGVLGGLLENLSLVIGISGLGLVAAAVYAGSVRR